MTLDETLLAEFGSRYTCDACFRDISDVVRIRCASCPELDLCVACFGAGFSRGAHSPAHSYFVFGPLNFALFDASWRADEELALVEACEKKGLGNWRDVALHLNGSRKSAEECARHYAEVYIASPAFPYAHPTLTAQITQKTAVDPKAPSAAAASATISTKNTNNASEEDLPRASSLASQPASHEIAGFMPKRRDFDVEFDNDFENSIKDLTFGGTEEDTPEETQLKLLMLRHYCNVLDVRAERKKFVFERQLTAFRSVHAAEKTRPKIQRDAFHATRKMARFMQPSHYEAFVSGLVWENELISRVSALQQQAFAAVAGDGNSLSLSSVRSPGIGILTSSTPSSTLQQPPPAIPSSAAAPMAKAVADMYIFASSSSPVQLTAAASTGSTSPASPAAAAASVPERRPSAIGAPEAASVEGSKPFGAGQLLLGMSSSPLAATVSSSLPNAKRKMGHPIDLTDADGVELLSPNEIELCSILRLLPKLYLSIKDSLLRENAKNGHLKRASARALIKIDVNKTGKIYDFFVAAGWISPKPPTGAAAATE